MSKTLAVAIAVLTLCIGLVIGMGLMGSEIDQLKEEISQLRAQKATLEKRITALHNQIEDRDEQNLELKKEIDYLEERWK